MQSKLKFTKEDLNDENGIKTVETFAFRVFLIADNEDRQQKTSMRTAKTFLAASNFLDILKLFGPISADLQEKIRYAKWRAAEIGKAIREGRSPNIQIESGDIEQNDNLEDEEQGDHSHAQISTQPQNFDLQEESSIDYNTKNVSVANKYSEEPEVVPTSSSVEYNRGLLDKAEKHSRYAISALQFDDVPTAIKNLQLALQTLAPYMNK